MQFSLATQGLLALEEKPAASVGAVVGAVGLVVGAEVGLVVGAEVGLVVGAKDPVFS